MAKAGHAGRVCVLGFMGVAPCAWEGGAGAEQSLQQGVAKHEPLNMLELSRCAAGGKGAGTGWSQTVLVSQSELQASPSGLGGRGQHEVVIPQLGLASTLHSGRHPSVSGELVPGALLDL